jgi:hypothetical protein
MNSVYESGAASLRVELKKGTIYVYHGTDGDLLFCRTAFDGDWSKIIERLKYS